jgi:hypothetical protein
MYSLYPLLMGSQAFAVLKEAHGPGVPLLTRQFLKDFCMDGDIYE